MPRSIQRIDLIKRLGKPIEFSADDRTRVEAAYGRKLTSEQWAQITGATSLLTALGGGIESLAPMRVVSKKLQKLTDAARSVREELSEKPLPSYKNSTLQAIHSKFFNHVISLPNAGHLSLFLLHVLNSTIATSEFMAEALNKKPDEEKIMMGFSEGQIWTLWVLLLTNIMKNHRLPYKVRKDTDKRKGETPSPFVALIWELQQSLPKELRKFTQSHNALAQGIYRARSDARF